MKLIKSFRIVLGCTSLVISIDTPAAESVQTVSVAAHKAVTGGAGSYAPKFSADGRYVVYVSHANNLVMNDDRGPFLDVFRHDLMTGETKLVSVDTSGNGGGDGNSNYPDISEDGRYVAFVSAAGNLVNNDSNGVADIFVRDLVLRTTVLVSVNAVGTQSGQFLNSPINVPWSANPRLSADGRKVVFDSLAPDLTANDTNAIRDVFLRNLDSGTTLLISGGSSMVTNLIGVNYNRFGSFAPMMTPDGNRVVFSTTATNGELALGNPLGEICVREVSSGLIWWVSSNAPGYFSPGIAVGSTNPVISADGHRVVYSVTSGGGSSALLISHDIASGLETILSSNAPSRSLPSLSADGRYIAYEEGPPFGNGIYVWDSQAQSKTLVSVGAGTVRASYSPSMTPDGRFVAFVSSSSGLVTNEVTADAQVYVRDRVTGTTRLVSANPEGKGTTDHSYVVPSINRDGTLVAFDSVASDLVANDLNQASDVFVRNIGSGTTTLLSRRQAALPSATGGAYVMWAGGGISADGRFLLFGMSDGFEVPGDTNRLVDLFVRDRVMGTNIPVTTTASGQAATNYTSHDRVLSGNGRYVAYMSGVTLLRRDLQTGLDDIVTNMTGAVAGLDSRDLRRPLAMSGDGNQIAFLGSSEPAQLFVRNMAAGTHQLASRNRFGTGGCNSACTNAVISPDGRWVVFISAATDLVTNAVTGPNLFGRDLIDGTLVLIGTNVAGSFAYSYSPVISANSRRVAYVQPGVSNFIAVYDFGSRTKTQASPPGQFSLVRNPALSVDGRFVVFEGRTPIQSIADVYRSDLEAGATTLVSVSMPGSVMPGGNHSSSAASVSADGRFVAFYSTSFNLDGRATSEQGAIYVRDMWNRTTILVSQSSDGTTAGNGGSRNPVMSANGRVLAFLSFANDLTGDDFNGGGDIFVLNLGGFDMDGDGMDDSWEMTYFNGLFRDGTGDFDQDGVSDLDEFRAGTDPTNGDSVFQVLTVTPHIGGSVTAVWSAVPGSTYRLQYKLSVNSAPWTDVAGDVIATGNTASKTFSLPTGPPIRLQYFRAVLLQ